MTWLLATLACVPDPPEETSAPPDPGPCATDHRAAVTGPTIEVGTDVDSLTDAIAAAPSGTTILLPPGTYTGSHQLDTEDVHIVGACAEAVLLDASEEPDGAVWLHGDGTSLADVSVWSGTTYGVFSDAPTARLTRVGVEGGHFWGIAVNGGRLDAEDLEVSGITCLGAGTNACMGLNLEGAELYADGLYLHDNEGYGLYLRSGSVAELGGLEVRGQRVSAGVDLADAIAAFDSRVRLAGGAQIRDVQGFGIYASGGSVETVDAVEIDAGGCQDAALCAAVGLDAGSTGRFGPGLVVERAPGVALVSYGDALSLDGAVFTEGARSAGSVALLVVGVDEVSVRDTVISTNGGPGVSLSGVGQATLADLELDGNVGFGLYLYDSTSTLERVTVRATEDGGDGVDGVGLAVGGGSVSLDGVTLTDNAEYGMITWEAQVEGTGLDASGNHGAGLVWIASVVDLAEVTVSATEPAWERGWGGYGVWVGTRLEDLDHPTPGHEGPAVRLEGLSVAGSVEAGVVVTDGQALELDGADLSGTTPRGGTGGDQVVVSAAARLDAVGLATSGGSRASVLFEHATGSLDTSTGDEALGLVQQGCDGIEPVEVAGSRFAAVHLCDTTELPLALTPPVIGNDVEVDP